MIKILKDKIVLKYKLVLFNTNDGLYELIFIFQLSLLERLLTHLLSCILEYDFSILTHIEG